MTMGDQIPVIAEKPLVTCGCKKFQLDVLDDHLLLVPPTRVPKRHTTGRLINSHPLPLVLDLLIVHDRFGRRSDPNLNGHLHYLNDVDRSLNEPADDKIRKSHL
jgi:hypothetical protein